MTKQYYFYKGRVALSAILRSFGVTTGNVVLMPGYTCVVVPMAVRYLDAVPVYTDIDPCSYNAHLFHYEEAYERLKILGLADMLRVVIVQHTYGNPNRDTQNILKWARQKGLLVVEDCAHTNGVSIDGRNVGEFGDAAFFSTQWSKPFTTGLGGIAQLNNPVFENQMSTLSQSVVFPDAKETMILGLQLLAHNFMLFPGLYWFAINTHRLLAKKKIFIGSSSISELDGTMPQDYFKGMSALQLRFLEKRRRKMDVVNKHRVWLAEEYDRLLTMKNIPIFNREKGAVLIRYPVKVEDKESCLRDAKLNRVELGDWFNYPLHPIESNRVDLHWEEILYPNALSAARHTINLPVHKGINYAEAKRIVDFITSYIIK